MKPQNISVTSDDCRGVGQYSEVSVIAVGIAPPRPRPVTKRSQVSDVMPGLNADTTLAAPKHSTDDDQHRLSAVPIGDGPDDEGADHQPEKTGGEKRAEPGDVEHPLGAECRRDVKPTIATSKPSMATTRKQRRSSLRWTADSACESMNA